MADTRTLAPLPSGNPDDGPAVTVWMDGDCPVCRAEMAFWKRMDRAGRVRFVDVMAADPAACPLDAAALLARFHAREGTDGPLLSGPAAFGALISQVPPFRPLGRWLMRPWAGRLLEPVYRLFLAMRGLWRRRAG